MKTLALLLLSLPLLALAQLVPLELDQTIPLPSSSPVWDVMPDTSGNYLWVQAVQPETLVTRIYWGRTDSVGVDSFDLAVGAPQSVTCFWRGNYEPSVLLASRYLTATGGLWEPWDSTRFRVYCLTNESADSLSYCWPSRVDLNPYNRDIYHDFRIGVATPWPNPPSVSSWLPAAITHNYHGAFHWDQYTSATNGMRYIVIRDMLAGLHPWEEPTPTNPGGEYCHWASSQSGLVIGCSSYEESAWNGQWGYGSTLSQTTLLPDTTMDLGWVNADCNANSHTECFSNLVATTFDTQQHAAITFSYWHLIYGAVDSHVSGNPLAWAVPGPYEAWLAAEVVGTNPAEEFLCYSNTRRVFDVLGAIDGHDYGVTDTITVGSEPRIIGRYDSTTRRLVFRDGNQLKLYRFGEYLAADDNSKPTQVEAYALSAYPNPFNSSTMLEFSLTNPQRVGLVIYDLTGRQVRVLADATFDAGEHRLPLDASALPSGLYFARLSAGRFVTTQKLLLLK